MNLLAFHLEVDFGEDLRLVANNEVDLENYLIEKGYSNIEFSDLRTNYGTCSLKNQYEKVEGDIKKLLIRRENI
jgi:hypothetical protein